jgi:hypothetical protein
VKIISRLLWLAGLVTGLLAFSATPAFAQIIAPTDDFPIVTSAPVPLSGPPAGLFDLTIDWSALGFSYDPTLDFNNATLADVGPSADPLTDPPPTGGTLIVGNNPASCPSAQYASIQGAVTAAAPGAHIKVCPGTYVEQVVVPAGKNDLTLQSEKPLQAVIQAPASMTTPKAIVRIEAQNVRIQQFTIQGPGGGPCDSLEEGVFVRSGGSAVIEHNHITHIRDMPLSGCQNGIAVQIGRNLLMTTGSATVTHNRIDDFQKGGVVIDRMGSSGDVEKNVVQGVGPTALIAANGIQISRGATAQVENNDVSGNCLHARDRHLDWDLALPGGRNRCQEQQGARQRHGDLRLPDGRRDDGGKERGGREYLRRDHRRYVERNADPPQPVPGQRPGHRRLLDDERHARQQSGSGQPLQRLLRIIGHVWKHIPERPGERQQPVRLPRRLDRSRNSRDGELLVERQGRDEHAARHLHEVERTTGEPSRQPTRRAARLRIRGC